MGFFFTIINKLVFMHITQAIALVFAFFGLRTRHISSWILLSSMHKLLQQKIYFFVGLTVLVKYNYFCFCIIFIAKKTLMVQCNWASYVFFVPKKDYGKYAHMKYSKRGKTIKEIIQLQKPILLWEKHEEKHLCLNLSSDK